MPSLERRSARPDCVILVDPANQEAVATAHVLLELLKLGKELRLSPVVLKAGEDYPDYAVKALLVCSSGCFQSEAVASWLINLPWPQPSIFPIWQSLISPSRQSPTRTRCSEWKELSPTQNWQPTHLSCKLSSRRLRASWRRSLTPALKTLGHTESQGLSLASRLGVLLF